jgi:rod shape-determining protein MreD
VPITYTSGEQIEVYRFSMPVTIGVPVLALFLQAYVPRRLPFFSIFDLPLLVTIFFAMARRNPISGLFTGAAIGLAQDMLGAYPIGIYGIAKTVVGYGASSLGAKAGCGEFRGAAAGDAGILFGSRSGLLHRGARDG